MCVHVGGPKENWQRWVHVPWKGYLRVSHSHLEGVWL